jgi:hypothetical protein
MNFFNCHKINIDELLLNNILLETKSLENISFILNTKKTQFNLLEKFIYEISSFHLNKLNILDNSSVSIEFCFKTQFNNNLVLETYENEIPLLKTLTFLNESENFSIISNINNEDYKFKNFVNEKNICLCLHKKMNHLSFDGGNFFHTDLIKNINSNLENNNNLILSINIWNNNLINKKIFDSQLIDNKFYNNNILSINEKNNIKNIKLENKQKYDSFFEKIFYLKYYELFNDLYNEINQEDRFNENFIFNFLNINAKLNIIENLDIKQTINTSSKKFIQRFNYKNFYNTFSCNWLINEINNYIINNTEFINNKNKINIENINSILNFVLFSFQQIIKFLCISYSIDENNNEFQISDIFIIKNINNDNLQDLSNNFEQDKSTFSIKILLNNNFSGGNLIFDDDLIYYLEKGEMIIHNGNDKCNFKSIENGTQYVLCGLINIYNK